MIKLVKVHICSHFILLLEVSVRAVVCHLKFPVWKGTLIGTETKNKISDAIILRRLLSFWYFILAFHFVYMISLFACVDLFSSLSLSLSLFLSRGSFLFQNRFSSDVLPFYNFYLFRRCCFVPVGPDESVEVSPDLKWSHHGTKIATLLLSFSLSLSLIHSLSLSLSIYLYLSLSPPFHFFLSSISFKFLLL